MSAYVGEIMMASPAEAYDFDNTRVIVVSGSFPNFCGHMLLCVGPGGVCTSDAVYMHVAGVRDYPRYMNEMGYRQYMSDEGKQELKRIPIRIPRPNNAMLKLTQLLAAKWTWGVLPHNCASFVEDIIRAGGNAGGLYMNCPRYANPKDFD